VDENDKESKQLINRLNKKVTSKLSEEEFNLLKIKMMEITDFAEDLKSNYALLIDKMSHFQSDYNISLGDKFVFLNSKLELFQKEIEKIWQYEEGIEKELELLRVEDRTKKSNSSLHNVTNNNYNSNQSLPSSTFRNK